MEGEQNMVQVMIRLKSIISENLSSSLIPVFRFSKGRFKRTAKTKHETSDMCIEIETILKVVEYHYSVACQSAIMDVIATANN